MFSLKHIKSFVSHPMPFDGGEKALLNVAWSSTVKPRKTHMRPVHVAELARGNAPSGLWESTLDSIYKVTSKPWVW